MDFNAISVQKLMIVNILINKKLTLQRKTFLGYSGIFILGSFLGFPKRNEYHQNESLGDSADNTLKEQNISLFLAGDVMTGRGIDQILLHSVDPKLYEPSIKNARDYVWLAESKNGPIPQNVSYDYIWGDAMTILDTMRPDVRIINLETAITTSDDHDREKSIHYRMHPENIYLLTVAHINICSIANNHVLDWGTTGLLETLRTLKRFNIQSVGAGSDEKLASEPAIIDKGNSRILFFAYGSPMAGVPADWKAGNRRPGVNILPEPDLKNTEDVIHHIKLFKKENDCIIVSLHWGSNWGYEIPKSQRKFAHALIDNDAADIIYGHSSHHPKGIEVYKNRTILYGCGDLINDYEGISGYEEYRDDLSLMYFPTLDRSCKLNSFKLVPMQIRRFQLRNPSKKDFDWLGKRLDRECRKLGTSINIDPSGKFYQLKWK